MHEHKHFTEENSNPVVYNTDQLIKQRKAFSDKEHVLTISSDLPLRKPDPLNKNEKCDQPPCRPSLNIKERSEVLYFDNKKGAITHKWSVRKECWVTV